MPTEPGDPRPPQRRSSKAREGGSAQPLGPGDQAPSVRRPARPPVIRPGGTEGAPQQSPRAPQQSRPAQSPPSRVPRTRVMPVEQQPAHQPTGRPGYVAEPGRQPGQPQPPRPPGTPRRRRRGRRALVIVAVVLVLLLAWPIGLLIWANGKIQHIDALSGAPSQDAETYLLAGSDSRADGELAGDPTEGQRTDTIMLLTKPPSGSASLISIPRDTYVAIPGHGSNKINASYSFGGPELLVRTVEDFTGLTVDHYVEIGMGGVADLVDATGGVELCSDLDVDDEKSGLTWTPGCHDVDGATALAFARMRYSDPKGDIGRTDRQQQVIKAITAKAANAGTLLNPAKQVDLLAAGLGAVLVDQDTNILDLGRLALAFRAATGPDGVRGTPPIADLNYRPGGVGSAVLITPEAAEAFFASVADGTVTIEDEE